MLVIQTREMDKTDYINYLKSITDTFIKMMSDEEWYKPQYKELPDGTFVFESYITIDTVPDGPISYSPIIESDKELREKRERVQEAWVEERNKRGVKYLADNIITYKEFLKRNPQQDIYILDYTNKLI